jgi:hypothetical protein
MSTRALAFDLQPAVPQMVSVIAAAARLAAGERVIDFLRRCLGAVNVQDRMLLFFNHGFAPRTSFTILPLLEQ